MKKSLSETSSISYNKGAFNCPLFYMVEMKDKSLTPMFPNVGLIEEDELRSLLMTLLHRWEEWDGEDDGVFVKAIERELMASNLLNYVEERDEDKELI